MSYDSRQANSIKRETQLINHETYYRELLDKAVDAIFVTDLDGHYIEVNPAACALLGYSRAELLEKSIGDLIPEDEHARLASIRRELMLGQPHFGEWHLRHHNGTLIPVEVSTRIMPDGRWQAIVRDMTERQRLQDELRRSERNAALAEERFRAMIEQAPDAIVIADAHGLIQLVNRQTEILFGYAREALLGTPIERLIPRRFAKAHRHLRATYMAHPVARPMAAKQELFGRRANGREFPIEVSLGPVAMDGETHVIATCRDATERRQMERTLRTRTETLTRTFEAMSEGVYIYSAEGKLIQMNAAARAIAGFDLHPEWEREPTQARLARFQPRDAAGHPVPPETWPVRRVLRGEVITDAAPVELIVTSATGREVYQQITGAPLRDGAGKPVGAVLVVYDVTEQRRLEQQRTDILRVVAHDLANPVAAVKMYLQSQERHIRQGQPPRTPNPELLLTMSQAITRMERLLGDMRVAVSFESNELSFDVLPCDLAELCRQEAQAIQVATERDIGLALPVEPIMVRADRDRIGQVIANLLSNAHKYSPFEQPISMTMRLNDNASDASPNAPRLVRVEVSDTGPGIPRNEQTRIWQRFHRVPGIQPRPGTGGSLGLGLYICRAIIEHHGGAVGVESIPGEGSTFWFTLPLNTPAE